LQHHLFGDGDDAANGAHSHWDTAFTRGGQIDVVIQRTNSLNQLQIRTGSDNLPVDDAGALGDQRIRLRDKAQNLVAGGEATHCHVQAGWRSSQAPFLMLLA
jgi:hypothetical protein